jgi:hypothetical protein
MSLTGTQGTQLEFRNWTLWGTELDALGYGMDVLVGKTGRFGVRDWTLWGTKLAALGYGIGSGNRISALDALGYGTGRFGVRGAPLEVSKWPL